MVGEGGFEGVLGLEGAGIGFREAPKPQEWLLEAPSSHKSGNFGGGDKNIPLGAALIPYWDTGAGKQGMLLCSLPNIRIWINPSQEKSEFLEGTLESGKMGILAPKEVPRAWTRHRGTSSSSQPSLLPMFNRENGNCILMRC